MTWALIRTNVATLMDTVSGVEVRPTARLGKADSVTATVIPGDPVLQPSGHQNKWDIRFSVRVKASKAKLEESQTAIDTLIWPVGAGSLIAAIYSDSTLGGVVDDFRVEEVVNYEQSSDSNDVQADIRCLAKVTA